jgi:hypothetical protein
VRLHELRFRRLSIRTPEHSKISSPKERTIRDAWVERVSALVDDVVLEEQGYW